MSLGLVRGLLTLTLFLAFMALWVWAWSKHRKSDFEAAAMLSLEDGHSPQPRAAGEGAIPAPALARFASRGATPVLAQGGADRSES